MKPRFFGMMVAILTIPCLTTLAYNHPARAQTENLSRSSSLNVENRSISDDYRRFFETRQNIVVAPLSNVQNYNVFVDGDDGRWRLNEDLKLFVNEPLVETNLLISPQRELYEGINRVEVRIEPTE